ncbi:MAG: hypothetical protein D6771_04365, partial [Zetaproteobacteria bacterium]
RRGKRGGAGRGESAEGAPYAPVSSGRGVLRSMVEGAITGFRNPTHPFMNIAHWATYSAPGSKSPGARAMSALENKLNGIPGGKHLVSAARGVGSAIGALSDAAVMGAARGLGKMAYLTTPMDRMMGKTGRTDAQADRAEADWKSKAEFLKKDANTQQGAKSVNYHNHHKRLNTL